MPLTELQLPTKESFYNVIRLNASEMDRLMNEWGQLAEFIAKMDNTDMDAMGVATGQVRTDLVEFRTVLDEMISFYRGNPVTATNAPDAVIDKVRRMI
jgi:hypothetical protein